MVQNITKSVKEIVKSALTSVPAISPEEAMKLIDRDAHVFVDLRDGTEQARSGMIQGAVASSRGVMEFHIDPGGRSALAAQVAMDMGLSPVVNMSSPLFQYQ